MKSLLLKLISVNFLIVLFFSTPLIAAPIEIKVAYGNHPGEPTDIVMNSWANNLKEKSNGKIILQLYPSSQLGSQSDIMDQALMGLNVITITDVGFLAEYEPDLAALYGPYLTKDKNKLFELYDSPWFNDKKEALKKHGVHLVITNYDYGDRHIIANKPINTPKDLKGMKIRVPNNKIQIKTFEALGATPTPMPLGEVYPALTQGVIDGAENPLSVLYGQKLHEPVKYLSMIRYLTTAAVWMGGEIFFNTLSPEDVKMIHETGFEAGLVSQKLASKNEASVIEKMKLEGVKIIYPDLELFKEKAIKVYSEFPDWTPGLYDELQQQFK